MQSVSTMPGIFAWGMVSGMAMVKSGLTLWQATGMTMLVFAGSAQLASLPLIAADAPLSVVFFTAIIVNLRFVIFAASIGPHFAHLNWRQRFWYGYFNADIMMALFPRRFPPEKLYVPQGKVGFFSGIAYPNWLAWQSGAMLGIIMAGQIPQSWGIGFAGTLALFGVMIPLVINRAALLGVVVSGAVALLGMHWPYRLGLLAAVVAGMVAAMLFDILHEGEGKT
ncbi:MAG TPA: AzlC family ABC transporter permease [Burkholderiaceae bacterium]